MCVKKLLLIVNLRYCSYWCLLRSFLKRSLSVFTPLVFGVAHRVIDIFLIIQKCKPFFVGLSSLHVKIPYVSAIMVDMDVVPHFPQKTKNLTLWVKRAIQQSNFCNVQNLILPRIEKEPEKKKKAKIGRVVSSRIPCEPLYHLTFPRFWHFSEETRCLLLRHREEESVLEQVHHVCISQWYSLLKA